MALRPDFNTGRRAGLTPSLGLPHPRAGIARWKRTLDLAGLSGGHKGEYGQCEENELSHVVSFLLTLDSTLSTILDVTIPS
jgi:hypothetical protein